MVEDKIKQLTQEKHWTEPVLLLDEIFTELGEPSIRSLADTVSMSKSWVDKSLQLAKGLRIWPELKDHKSRHSAYRFILKKRKHYRSINK